MKEHVRKLDSFSVEDGHIESVLVGLQEIKVSFQDWRARKIVIIFHGVEEFHGMDSESQSIIYQDIGEFIIQKVGNETNEYSFVGAWDEKAFLKIRAKVLEIYEIGVATNINSALFEMDLSYIGDQNDV